MGYYIIRWNKGICNEVTIMKRADGLYDIKSDADSLRSKKGLQLEKHNGDNKKTVEWYSFINGDTESIIVNLTEDIDFYVVLDGFETVIGVFSADGLVDFAENNKKAIVVYQFNSDEYKYAKWETDFEYSCLTLYQFQHYCKVLEKLHNGVANNTNIDDTKVTYSITYFDNESEDDMTEVKDDLKGVNNLIDELNDDPSAIYMYYEDSEIAGVINLDEEEDICGVYTTINTSITQPLIDLFEMYIQ